MLIMFKNDTFNNNNNSKIQCINNKIKNNNK